MSPPGDRPRAARSPAVLKAPCAGGGFRQHPARDRPVPRELFPLPLLKRESVLNKQLSQSVRRRMHRRWSRADSANAVIRVLNEIHGLDTPLDSPVSQAQHLAMLGIVSELHRLPRPASLYTTHEAIDALQLGSHAYSAVAPSPVRPYRAEAISIPPVGQSPPQVGKVLDPLGASIFNDFQRFMLWDEAQWGLISEQEHHIRPYMDEVLRSSVEAYHQFAKQIYDANMICFTTRPTDIVTPFFVGKKDGVSLRLIWDTRIANRRFRPLRGCVWHRAPLGATWSYLMAHSYSWPSRTSKPSSTPWESLGPSAVCSPFQISLLPYSRIGQFLLRRSMVKLVPIPASRPS